MSDKFLEVAKRIAEHPELISETATAGENDEYYFRFRNAVLSILRRDESGDWGRYSLYLYPKQDSLAFVMRAFDRIDSPEIPMVSLHASYTRQAEEVLADVYNVVKNKDLGIDDLLDRLLS
jgi:hypothetical protein